MPFQAGANSVISVDETYEIRNGQPVKYVFAGDQRVARIRGSEVHYFHKDHLGSSTLVTDAAGGLLESTTYEPYGLQRPDCDPKLNNVAYTFTDQEWDSETGLYNYDARLYDPVLGRFLTADSVIPNWYDPQALNRYAYARNNPLKYIDPDGHTFFTWLRRGNFADPYSDPTPIVKSGMYYDRRTNQWLGGGGGVESVLIEPADLISLGTVAIGKAIIAKSATTVATTIERKIATEAVEEAISKSIVNSTPITKNSLIEGFNVSNHAFRKSGLGRGATEEMVSSVIQGAKKAGTVVTEKGTGEFAGNAIEVYSHNGVKVAVDTTQKKIMSIRPIDNKNFKLPGL